MAKEKKAKAVEAAPTNTQSTGQTANAEIQDVAQQIGKILKDHGLGMQASIEIFKLEVLNPDVTGMIPGTLKEVITDEGRITNVTPNQEVMNEMLRKDGDAL